jgi:hypothetical protein
LLIEDKFPAHANTADQLLRAAFQEKLKAQLDLRPAVAPTKSNLDESDDNDAVYYPEKKGASQEEDEIKKYKAGAWPLGKKGNPLQWWKVSL